jgi:hypothetical protein
MCISFPTKRKQFHQFTSPGLNNTDVVCKPCAKIQIAGVENAAAENLLVPFKRRILEVKK